jgi:hypothetical protein
MKPDREQIVEVVSDAAGQIPDRFQDKCCTRMVTYPFRARVYSSLPHRPKVHPEPTAARGAAISGRPA